MSEPSQWRDLLTKAVQTPQGRQRLAQALRVNPSTLARWAKGKGKPRPHTLSHLLTILAPDAQQPRIPRTEGLKASSHAPSTSIVSRGETHAIPSSFYTRVLTEYARFPLAEHCWSIRHLVLQHACEYLDPSQEHAAVILLQCLPPFREQKIRCLRSMVGVGKPPWGGDVNAYSILLGAESLMGHVVTMGHAMTNPNTSEVGGMLPPPPIEQIASEIAAPIKREGRLAGCLYACSSRAHTFLSSHLTPIQDYANLIALAFEPEDFYEPGDIALQVLPPACIQPLYQANFRERVAQTLQEAWRTEQPLSVVQAEQVVWHQLAEEFVHLGASTQ